MHFNVLDYGAIGDGINNDTAAIQAALDACDKVGGGTVILPGPHTYRSGVLVLHSNLELHLEMGALLKGSDNLDDYLLSGTKSAPIKKREVPSYENCEYSGAPTHFFLYAKDCENLAITGFGRIDGNEEIFYGDMDKYHIEGFFYPRAPLLFMENVSHLTLKDVTLTNSAFWTVHLVGCKDVLIDGIRILNNLKMANCDGIDPDRCQNVRIANCHIVCADDCIVFKNTLAYEKYGTCENIVVNNCTLTSTSAAIKFGSESEDVFRNIFISNCTITNSNRGISLQLRDKGSIENIVFENISINTRLFKKESYWGAAEPIAITAIKRNEDTETGFIHNIHFNNIFCRSENGILIYADKHNLISDITFSNVFLSLCNNTKYEKGYHDLRPTISDNFTKQGLSYVYANKATDISFKNCSFSIDDNFAKDLVETFHLDDCTNFTF